MSIFDLIDEFADAEENLRGTQFLAPCLPGAKIAASAGGLVHTFQPDKTDFEGWGIFKALNPKEAELVEEADLMDVEAYLALLKAFRVVLAYPLSGKSWMGYPANESDFKQRLGKAAPIPVHLVEAGQPMEQVVTRFDGSNFWYEDRDRNSDPFIPDELRRLLADEKISDELRTVKGLTKELTQAYDMNLIERLIEREMLEAAEARLRALEAERERLREQKRWEDIRRRIEQERIEKARRGPQKIREALAFAGSKFIHAVDHGHYWMVEWTTPAGRTMYTSVSKNDLTVISSGICLDGEDDKFDLQSLGQVIDNSPDWSWY